MMQERLAGKEHVLEKEILKEAHSVEDIREIIRTIEGYLIRTKETIERVEKFVQELKQETQEIRERESDRVKEEDKDPGREQDSPPVRL